MGKLTAVIKCFFPPYIAKLGKKNTDHTSHKHRGGQLQGKPLAPSQHSIVLRGLMGDL